MESQTTNRRFMAILVISLAASLVVPYVLASTTLAQTPTIPTQCTAVMATGWSNRPIINAKMTVRNYEDSGVVGYWALDNFLESFIIWQNNSTTPNTFCALNQYAGTWTTFAGALSPQNGVPEPHSGSGRMEGAIVKIFTGTFLGPYCRVTNTQECSGTYSTKHLTGNIGVFKLNGTKRQIMNGTYAEQATFSPISFLTFYFDTPSIISEPVWSWIYTHENRMGYGNMWVNDLAGSFGDIIT
jgi:hypothetical protein